jgi:hypothetical protein
VAVDGRGAPACRVETGRFDADDREMLLPSARFVLDVPAAPDEVRDRLLT